MPYFVYKVSLDRKQLTAMDVHDKFKPAKAQCKKLRESLQADDTEMVRMVFAKDKREAEVLLGEKHKPSSPLEEWEA